MTHLTEAALVDAMAEAISNSDFKATRRKTPSWSNQKESYKNTKRDQAQAALAIARSHIEAGMQAEIERLRDDNEMFTKILNATLDYFRQSQKDHDGVIVALEDALTPEEPV